MFDDNSLIIGILFWQERDAETSICTYSLN